MPANFRIGDFIRFNYELGTDVHDDYPEVLVLHTNWACSKNDTRHQCVHGLNFSYLRMSDVNYVLAVLNPAYELKMVKRDPSVATRIEQAGIHGLVGLSITSPLDFYVRFVRPFIKPKGWDPYRRYNSTKIRAVRILKRREVLVGEEKDSLFNRFIQKFQHMRGPRLPPGS